VSKETSQSFSGRFNRNVRNNSLAGRSFQACGLGLYEYLTCKKTAAANLLTGGILEK